MWSADRLTSMEWSFRTVGPVPRPMQLGHLGLALISWPPVGVDYHPRAGAQPDAGIRNRGRCHRIYGDLDYEEGASGPARF